MRAGDLSGFRGVRPAQLRDAYTASSRTEVDPIAEKYQRMLLGVAAEKAQAGLAERNEADQVLAAVVMLAERDAMESMQELLGIANLHSEAAMEAHHNARVAAGVVSYMNALIRDGVSAGREINEMTEE